MRYTRNYLGLMEMETPGSAGTLTRGNRIENTIIIPRTHRKVKETGPRSIFGASVTWTGPDGIRRSGTVTGEYCASITLSVFFYRVRTEYGSQWVAGKDLYREEAPWESTEEMLRR